MCFAGKKGKKKKGVTVDLMTFLGDDRNGPTPNMPLKSSSWADDVEDDHGMSRELSLNSEQINLKLTQLMLNFYVNFLLFRERRSDCILRLINIKYIFAYLHKVCDMYIKL